MTFMTFNISKLENAKFDTMEIWRSKTSLSDENCCPWFGEEYSNAITSK